MALKHKIGTKIRFIADTTDHKIKLGTTFTIKNIYYDEYYIYTRNGNFFKDVDCEEVESKVDILQSRLKDFGNQLSAMEKKMKKNAKSKRKS